MRRQPTAQTNDFGIALSSLYGALPTKLDAIRAAGFTRVLISAGDLVGHSEGVEKATTLIRQSRLEILGLDGTSFDGFSGPERAFKFQIAGAALQLCRAVGSPLLLVRTSSTSIQSRREQDLVVEDLRRLALLAVPLNVRVAFEPTVDRHGTVSLLDAIEIVQCVDMPNLGMSVEASCLSTVELDDTDGLDAIDLVRLADSLNGESRKTGTQVFPGDGANTTAIANVVKLLVRRGYSRPWAFDVDHLGHRSMPPQMVAERAARSARWLAEDVLRRSVPLPSDLVAGYSRNRPPYQ